MIRAQGVSPIKLNNVLKNRVLLKRKNNAREHNIHYPPMCHYC